MAFSIGRGLFVSLMMMRFFVGVDWAHFLNSAFTGILLACWPANWQHSPVITLHNEPQALAIGNYYIAGLADGRIVRNGIGKLFIAQRGAQVTEPQMVDFKGGFEAVRQFMLRCVKQDTLLTPVLVSLKTLSVSEKVSAEGLVSGRVDVVMDFSRVYGDVTEWLTEYRGEAEYTRQAGPPQQIEPTLRSLLKNGLLYLDKWIDRDKESNIKLAKRVEVTLADYNTIPEGDTIYYAVNRPLRWDDFRSRTANSLYAAQVFPSVGYSEKVSVGSGVVKLVISVKTMLPKSACWVKSGSETEYALNHEQRHFDIAKIASEYFKRKVAAEKLPVYNYDGPVNVDYLEAYRKMDTLQRQYDGETEHGMNHAEQERWNTRIDAMLKRYGISKSSTL